MFAPLPSPAEMSGWDRAAIDLGLPELLLMENASREALHVLSAETGHMRPAGQSLRSLRKENSYGNTRGTVQQDHC